MDRILRLGVVGVGRFGRNHARVYSELENVRLAAVADVDAACARDAAVKHGASAFTDYRELFGKVDAVSVTVPAREHARVVCAFLENGVAVLVEKPMAFTVEEARRMQSAAQASGAALQVGHILRFTPGVRAVREMNVAGSFLRVHRTGPPAGRPIDVGAVLDLMIHDIDLVLLFVHAPVRKVEAEAFGPAGADEDVCNARVTFDDGAAAELTASRVASEKRRTIRIFSSDGCVSLDFDSNSVLVMRRSGENSLAARDVEALKDLSTDRLKAQLLDRSFSLREVKPEGGEPLKAELQSFVDCVLHGTAPAVSGEDGVRSMELAGKILEAAGRRKSGE
jgi:predicted dehydrogenase